MTETYADPFGALPPDSVEEEAAGTSRRTPLLLAGLAAVVLAGGAYLLFGGSGGDSTQALTPTVATPRGPVVVSPSPAPSVKLPPVSQVQLGRNPFKALYVAPGGGGGTAGGGTGSAPSGTSGVPAGFGSDGTTASTPVTTSPAGSGSLGGTPSGSGSTSTPPGFGSSGGSPTRSAPTSGFPFGAGGSGSSGGTVVGAPSAPIVVIAPPPSSGAPSGAGPVSTAPSAPAQSTVALKGVKVSAGKPTATFVYDGKTYTGSPGQIVGGKLLIISLQQDLTGSWFANLQLGDGVPFEVHERQTVVVQ